MNVNKLFMTVGQIVVGVAVGNLASDAVTNGIVKPIKKVITNKKEKKA